MRRRFARTYLLLLPLLCSALWPSGAGAAFTDESASRLPQEIRDSYAIAAGDVDGNGTTDLVVATAGQTLLFLNDGNGVFTDATGQLPAIDATVLGLVLEDVDGDLQLDIVLANTSGPNLLLINDGLGTFSDESGLRLPGHDEVSTDVAVLDVNQDDAPDIVVANRGSTNRLLINDGAGSFADAPDGDLPTDGDLTQAVAIADVNDDGASDLFFASDGGQNRLYTGNGLGQFTDATGIGLPGFLDETLDAAFGDVDDDGDPDLLIANGAAGVSLLLNAAGTFTMADPTALPALPDYAIAVALDDVDFDGSPDVVVANAGQDRLLLNDGAGVFQDATSDLPANDSRSFGLVLADVDADFDLDVTLAVPQAADRLLVDRTEYPRIRISVSPDFIVVGDTVTFEVEAFDEDGVVETTLEVNGTPVTLDAGGIGTYIPLVDGLHTAVVTSLDTLGNVGTRSVTFVVAPPDLAAPTVTLAIIAPTPILVGQPVTIQATAADAESGVASLVVTVNGQPIPVDSSGAGIYVPGVDGTYTVVAEATDFAGNVGTETDTFDVLPDLDAPVVSLSATPDPVDITMPISISVSATDNVAVATLTLGVSGPGITGEDPVPVDASGQATYIPYVPGTFTLTARATDHGGNEGVSTLDFEAAGVPDTEAPVVTIQVVPGAVALGGPVTVTVTATDNVLVASTSLEINGTPVPLDAAGVAVFTPPVLGSYTATGLALDPTGNLGSALQVFQAVDPATDTDPPFVAIAAPAEGSEITSLTDIVGTTDDLTLTQYTLSFAPAGSSQFTTFASGTTSVVNGVLGTFDPTLLENGLYRVRLRAQDVNGLVAIVERDYIVEGDAKIGHFRLSFTDVSIPVAGVPITVQRTYDSRVKSQEDFGIGWTLDTKRGSYTNNRAPGDGWVVTSGGGLLDPPCTNTNETKLHQTEIRFSDSLSYVFRTQLNMYGFGSIIGGGCLGDVQFVQVDGPPGATLVPIGSNTVFWFNGGDYFSYDLVDANFGDVWEPADVRLSTAEGNTFDLNLQTGLSRIEDRNGNTLSFTAGGIVHSAGKSVAFTRDGSGRIAQITDPLGNTVAYEYDAAGDLVAVTDQVDGRTTITYDSNHNLLDYFDPAGNRGVRSEYDDDGRLIATIDAFGNRMEFTHDIAGRQEVVTDRLGRARVLVYDDDGNVISETHPDGTSTARSFDTRGNRLSETDPLGNTTVFSYDANDNRVSETDPLGHTTTFTYDSRNNRLTETDPLGNVTTNTYDAVGNHLTVTDPEGNVRTFTYDTQGNRTSETDPLGNVTTHTYDGFGNLTGTTDPLGHVTSYTYDANGNQLTETRTRVVGGTPETLVTIFEYDATGRVVRTTHPDGSVETRAYDERGNLIEQTDPLGHLTAHEYDAASRRTRTVFPDGTEELLTYDAEGQLVGRVDRAGRTTGTTYDLRGLPSQLLFADGSSLTRSYDANGRVTSRTDPNGNTTTFEYDDAGRQTAEVDALGNRTEFTYNAVGNLVSELNAKGETTTFEYDATHLPVRELFPDGSAETFAYDAAQRPVSHTDQAGNQTTTGYDALGRMILLQDALGNQSTFGYDEVGNRVSQTDANGNTTLFAYDSLGREIQRTLPDGSSQARTYDAAGNVLSRTDYGGDTTVFAYDSEDRVTLRTHPDGSTAAFSYTPTGQRAAVTDARGVTSYTYDALDRLLGVTQPDGSGLTYAYDAASNLVTRNAAVGGTTLTESYAYDAMNRLASVTDDQGRIYSYTHDATHNVASLTYPNGVVTDYTYDALDRLTGLSTADSGSAVLQSYAYTLGAAGNRTQVQEADGTIRGYLHDAVYRLLRETVSDGGGLRFEDRYAYDAVGNRISVEHDEPSTTTATRLLTYDSRDRLLTEDTTSFGWDADGRLATRSGAAAVTNAWNSESRLVETTHADGTVVTHDYDADGNRVRTSVTPPGGSTAVTHYLVDPIGPRAPPLSHVVAETDGTDALLASYVRGGDQLLAVIRPGGTRFYHADGLGSTRRLTDETGAVTDVYEYDAFGVLLQHTGSDPNRYLFAGEPLGPKDQFYYNRARWMDSGTGRFLSVDPLDVPFDEFEGTGFLRPSALHRYLYASNDPVDFTDPTGEFVVGIGGLTVSINIQGNLRSTSGIAGRAALMRIRQSLGRLGVQSVKALRKIRPPGQQTHHLIEKRLWIRNPKLQRIFRHVDDIPGVNLTPAQHQVFTNAWRNALPRLGQRGYNAAPSLERIMEAASKVYANNPELLKQILLRLL